jgi:hypothetical protein
MSENIANMNDKQLRNAVQLLSDELAIMKRKYEDILYNLDTDNFSSRFVKEQGDMRTAIEITAEGIKTKVSKEDLKAYSTIEQTAEQITSTVTKEFVTDLIEGDIVTNATLESKIEQSADNIMLSVSAEYETKDEAYTKYSSLSMQSDSISSRVVNLETFKSSTFTQTSDGFLLDGEKSGFTGYIYLTNNAGKRRFVLSHDESQGYEQVFMQSVSGANIPTVLGDADGMVYIGDYASGNEIATRNWVLANAGSGGSGGTAVAVFG